jgi:hypothetical protein
MALVMVIMSLKIAICIPLQDQVLEAPSLLTRESFWSLKKKTKKTVKYNIA